MKNIDGSPVAPFVPRKRPVMIEDRIDIVPQPPGYKPPAVKRKDCINNPLALILNDAVYKTYLTYYGLAKDAWDETRNGPIASRCSDDTYMMAAYHFPHQHVRMSLNRDPAKFIFIMILQKTTQLRPLMFYIRNSLLDNSQFDELDIGTFPERTFSVPPTRFWHWVAGAKPHVKIYKPNNVVEIIPEDKYPAYTVSEREMRDHPHEIGLLSNRRHDGSIIDPALGDPESRGAFLYMCDAFHPVDPHEIGHTFIYRFPYPLTGQRLAPIVDPVTGEKKAVDQRTLMDNLPTVEEYKRLADERDADPAMRFPRRKAKKKEVTNVEGGEIVKKVRKPRKKKVADAGDQGGQFGCKAPDLPLESTTITEK